MVSFLKKLFGGGGDAAPAAPEVAESHKGFDIFATPRKEGGQWRLAGRIEKDVGGERKAHDFVRADLFQDVDEAKRFAVMKAKMMIDQMGDRLFD